MLLMKPAAYMQSAVSQHTKSSQTPSQGEESLTNNLATSQITDTVFMCNLTNMRAFPASLDVRILTPIAGLHIAEDIGDASCILTACTAGCAGQGRQL